MERALGLMAGAGVLPGRAAAEAARQGWRVVAFPFEQEAPGLDVHAHALVPSRLDNIQAVLGGLSAHSVSAAVFVGKFSKQRVFDHRTRDVDSAARHLAGAGLSDDALAGMVVATLDAMGIEVLDQRTFLSPWMVDAGVLTSRAPTAEEWSEIREGLALARRLADFGIGQTVVRCLGVTVAVEAAEGTDETIRRGARLAGPGAVVSKAVGRGQDYRFDVPTVGSATIEVMAEGGATALGIAGGKMLLPDRDELVRIAERAGITVVSVDESA